MILLTIYFALNVSILILLNVFIRKILIIYKGIRLHGYKLVLWYICASILFIPVTIFSIIKGKFKIEK
jgi:hypothetical protein